MTSSESDKHIIIMLPRDLAFTDRVVNFSVSFTPSSEPEVQFAADGESTGIFNKHNVPMQSEKSHHQHQSTPRYPPPTPYHTPPATGPIRRAIHRSFSPISEYKHEDRGLAPSEAQFSTSLAPSPVPQAHVPIPSPPQDQVIALRATPEIFTGLKVPAKGGVRTYDFTPPEMDLICAAIREGEVYSQVHQNFSRVSLTAFKTRYYRIKSDMEKAKVLEAGN